MSTSFHNTATKRNTPSAPARWSYENIGFELDPSDTLDYGCGSGKDVEYFGLRGWDINGDHKRLKRHDDFTTILCSYVLNVIPTEKERMQVISHIQKHLTWDGTAYLTVRNDKQHLTGWTKIGTYQTFGDQPLPIVHKTTGYM